MKYARNNNKLERYIQETSDNIIWMRIDNPHCRRVFDALEPGDCVFRYLLL